MEVNKDIITVEKYIGLINALIVHLKDVQFDCVLGVIRGGYIPAEAISRHYNKDLCLIRTVSYDSNMTKTHTIDMSPIMGNLHGDVLVVDDLVDSGDTLKRIKELLKGMHEVKSVRTAVIWNKNSKCEVQPDFYVAEGDVNVWIVQPMEWLFSTFVDHGVMGI